MAKTKIEISHPLCRIFEEGHVNSYTFEAEIEKGTKMDAFLKMLGDNNLAFQRILSTPGAQLAGQVAVTLNGRRLQFPPDFQLLLRNDDRIELALDYIGC
jgi:hypothetical protein